MVRAPRDGKTYFSLPTKYMVKIVMSIKCNIKLLQEPLLLVRNKRSLLTSSVQIIRSRVPTLAFRLVFFTKDGQKWSELEGVQIRQPLESHFLRQGSGLQYMLSSCKPKDFRALGMAAGQKVLD